MRLIHTSDIHIGAPMTSVLCGAKARERSRELLDGFAAMIRDGEAIGAEVIIIAGDLFDSERVPLRTVEAVLSLMREHSSLSFLLLPGNHEGEVVRSCGLKLPKNLKIFNTGWTYFDIGEVRIAGRSEIRQDMFKTLKIREGARNIVVLHGEARETGAREGVIPLRDASGLGIDYIALGHYHSFCEYPVDDGCSAVYCGTPEGRGFDECGKKGYVVLDVDGGGTKYTFRSQAKRTLHTITVDITGVRDGAEWEWRVNCAVQKIPASDLVRIEIVGRYEIGLIRDTDRLIRLFGHKFYHFEVNDRSLPMINMEDYKNDKSLRGEFIRSVMSDTTLSDEEKGEVISCGLYALVGEAIYDR